MAEKSFGKVLITQEEITKRAKEIAAQIDKDYEGEEVLFLGTLKGSVPWLVDIMKYTTVESKVDFISASSYGSSTSSSGVVKINIDPQINMYRQNVIIIEDIIDTGYTLKFVMGKLQERGPKSIRICTMLNKKGRRVVDIDADYVGFDIDDLFVIGYGLDYDQRFRGLPYVSYLDENAVENL